MTGPRRRYDVTITVDRDGDRLLNQAELTVTAQQAASARMASIITARLGAHLGMRRSSC
jgi:hypothetical protein